MKLFSKYNRVNLIATIVIFVLSSFAFYIALRFILVAQIDDDLRIERREIETFVNEHNALPESISVKDQRISYKPSEELFIKRKFRTVSDFEKTGRKREPFRVLEFGVTAGGKNFTATVAKSLEGTDDLIRSILLISFATILVILSASVILNRILLKRLWRPFYASLAAMKNFRVDKKQSLNLLSTDIEEFNFMNETLERTASQAQSEYSTLKEFTENASHEMQTPLAIIQSKLDLLVQTENLSEEQSKIMQSAYSAVEKLSRLNHSLLLLAKIGNNQFAETTLVNLRQRVEDKLEAFHELWQNQNISVSSNLEDASVNMNPELADILLNNVLSNATRHNIPDGRIRLELTSKLLRISNSGTPAELNQADLFARFSRPSGARGYNGLGLSIIKQICDVSHFVINYSFTNALHSFSIRWD